MIKPIFPPKAGYIEVEVDGIRKYKNIATGKLLEDELSEINLNDTVRAQNATITMMSSVIEDLQTDVEALKA